MDVFVEIGQISKMLTTISILKHKIIQRLFPEETVFI